MKVCGAHLRYARGSQRGAIMLEPSILCAQDGLGEESDTESENEIAKEKDAQVMAEEKLEEINLGTKP